MQFTSLTPAAMRTFADIETLGPICPYTRAKVNITESVLVDILLAQREIKLDKLLITIPLQLDVILLMDEYKHLQQL